MALHFLEHGFTLPSLQDPGTSHVFELYESGGQRCLRVWLGGQEPGAHIIVTLSKAQALDLAEAADGLAQRIND